MRAVARGSVPASASPRRRSTFYYLFRYQPTDAERPIPEMTGDDLELDGTRQDFDPQTDEPIVVMQFTERGRGPVPRHHARARDPRPPQDRPVRRATYPILQHFAIVLDGEIQSFPTIDFELYPDGISGNNGAQITRSRLDRGGEGPRARASDRGAAAHVRAGRPNRHLGDARRGLAARGGHRWRSAAWSPSLLFLLIVYRFLGVIAIAGLAIYGAAPLRRDPALRGRHSRCRASPA